MIAPMTATIAHPLASPVALVDDPAALLAGALSQLAGAPSLLFMPEI